MRILVVEDEHKIAQSIKQGLMQENYVVDVAYDGITGFDLASTEKYDVIILDVMLPGIDGVTISRRLREEKVNIPILMLTAKGQVLDRVEGLGSGADDYLVKPFAFEELVARIRALVRRPEQMVFDRLQIGDLSLDTRSFEVTHKNVGISLSPKEFLLLEYLLRHPGQTLTKDQILSHVWNYDTDILPNTIEVYVGYLRNKIDKPFKTHLIKTIRGFGYKIST